MNAAAFSPAALRGRLLSPSAALIGSNLAVNLLRIVSTMLLTRLLTPADFGIAGIISSIFFIVTLLTDTGFQAFVIRHERGEDPAFLDAVWTIHAVRGVLLFAGVALFSVPIGHLIDKPGVSPLLAVASLLLAIDGLASPVQFVALRRRNVARLSLIDLSVAVILLIATLVGAWIFRNAWAIVAGMIVSSTARTTATYLAYPQARRRIRFDPGISGELWRFARFIAASSFITMIIGQVDKLLLARAFTLPQFGTYSIAANLAAAPMAIVLLYAGRIVYPNVAAMWRTDKERIRETIYGGRGLVFYGYLFAAGGLIGCAPLVIRILYDPRYAEAAIYLRLLMVATAMSMPTRTIGESLVATGRTRTTLMVNIVRIVWLAVFGVAGLLLIGPIGIVIVLGLIEIPAYLYCLVVLRRLNLLDPLRETAAMLLIVAGGGIGWAVSTGAFLLFPR